MLPLSEQIMTLTSISRYIIEQRDVELEKCREKKEDLEDKILSNGSEKVEVEQDILKIKDDLATQQVSPSIVRN